MSQGPQEFLQRPCLCGTMSSRDKESTICWFFRAGWQGLRGMF